MNSHISLNDLLSSANGSEKIASETNVDDCYVPGGLSPKGQSALPEARWDVRSNDFRGII